MLFVKLQEKKASLRRVLSLNRYLVDCSPFLVKGWNRSFVYLQAISVSNRGSFFRNFVCSFKSVQVHFHIALAYMYYSLRRWRNPRILFVGERVDCRISRYIYDRFVEKSIYPNVFGIDDWFQGLLNDRSFYLYGKFLQGFKHTHVPFHMFRSNVESLGGRRLLRFLRRPSLIIFMRAVGASYMADYESRKKTIPAISVIGPQSRYCGFSGATYTCPFPFSVLDGNDSRLFWLFLLFLDYTQHLYRNARSVEFTQLESFSDVAGKNFSRIKKVKQKVVKFVSKVDWFLHNNMEYKRLKERLLLNSSVFRAIKENVVKVAVLCIYFFISTSFKFSGIRYFLQYTRKAKFYKTISRLFKRLRDFDVSFFDYKSKSVRLFRWTLLWRRLTSRLLSKVSKVFKFFKRLYRPKFWTIYHNYTPIAMFTARSLFRTRPVNRKSRLSRSSLFPYLRTIRKRVPKWFFRLSFFPRRKRRKRLGMPIWKFLQRPFKKIRLSVFRRYGLVRKYLRLSALSKFKVVSFFIRSRLRGVPLQIRIRILKRWFSSHFRRALLVCYREVRKARRLRLQSSFVVSGRVGLLKKKKRRSVNKFRFKTDFSVSSRARVRRRRKRVISRDVILRNKTKKNK